MEERHNKQREHRWPGKMVLFDLGGLKARETKSVSHHGRASAPCSGSRQVEGVRRAVFWGRLSPSDALDSSSRSEEL